MKSLYRWLGVSFLLAGLGLTVYGAGVTDLLDLCTGKNQSNCPYKIDASGNVTSAGTITSTSSGNSAFTGTTSNAGTTNSGLQVYAPTNPAAMGATTTIPVTATYETLVSTGANLLVTSTPSVSTSTVVGGSTAFADGTYLVLSSTSTQTITVQDNGTLSGSQLLLGANTRAVGNHKVLTLIYNATLSKWTEVSYANNN